MKSPTICSPCLSFITRHERRLSGQWQPNFTLRFHRTISSSFKDDLDAAAPNPPSQYCSYPPQDSRTSGCLTAPSIGGADFQQPLPNQRCGATEPRGERCSPRAMLCPHEKVRCDTQACCKCINSFQRSEKRRKLPLAIARAKGAISASYQVALPVLPGQ